MILQGDARAIPFKDKSVGGIITSPPYNVGKCYPNDAFMEHAGYIAFLKACYAECLRVCSGPVCWVLPVISGGRFIYAEVGEWKFLTPIVCGTDSQLGGNKPGKQGWNRSYVQVEALVATQSPKRAFVVWAPEPFIGPDDRNRPRWHPTPFVREVPSAAMQMYPEVTSWLDPFAGTGTTMLAARARGLRAISMDLKWEYCKGQVDEIRQGILVTAR